MRILNIRTIRSMVKMVNMVSRSTGARKVRLLALAVIIGVTLGPAAWAAAGTEGTWLGVPRVVWAWANLIVFWGLLWRFAVPPVRHFLANRKKAIAEGIDRAKTQAEEAKVMRAELGAQMAALRQELEEQKQRARAEGERERARILAQAEEDRTKLLEQADREIANRVAQARAELQRTAAALAADLAQQQLANSLGPDDQKRLFGEELQRLREVSS